MIASVVVELKNYQVDKPYDYMVSFEMEANIKIGSRVIVPFSNRDVEGFVITLKNETNLDLKQIKSVYDDFLSNEQLMLIKYLRERNPVTMIECINTILPPALRASIKNKTKKKFVKYLEIIDYSYEGSEKEQSILNSLMETEHTLSLANKKYGSYYINKFRKNNVVQVVEKEVYRQTYTQTENELYSNPTSEQKNIANEIYSSDKPFHLIFGATGSGKTVCYIELIKQVLNTDKQVLVLVPEISLTPQFINIIAHHIDQKIAVFHSKMSSSERYDQFRLVVDKKVQIAIGTRSAIFLPFDNLGLIIIDEEHDTSFVQEQKVSYSTKEIAARRVNYHNAKLVLGSATPEVTTFYNALNNKIVLHRLESPYADINVNNKIIDMKSNFDWILSKDLLVEIEKTISNDKQFMLILNRRGYANYLVCNSCGEALKCTKCDVTLTLHENNLLKCHHCNYQTHSQVCTCGSNDFVEYGYGIQKVEEMLHEHFNNLKLVRIDSDVLLKIKKLEKILDEINDKQYDGIVGTQILSKGLNFKDVNLVALLDADYSLNINSYKSSELTFQYINQTLGRNNRGTSKDVVNIVQTMDTSHYALQHAFSNDYESFYKQELAFRKQLQYPPFTNYSKILCSSSDLRSLIVYINNIYNSVKNPKIFVSKPHFSSIEKINNQYKMQILLKHSNISEIFDIINRIRVNSNKTITTIVNHNPNSF